MPWRPHTIAVPRHLGNYTTAPQSIAPHLHVFPVDSKARPINNDDESRREAREIDLYISASQKEKLYNVGLFVSEEPAVRPSPIRASLKILPRDVQQAV